MTDEQRAQVVAALSAHIRQRLQVAAMMGKVTDPVDDETWQVLVEALDAAGLVIVACEDFNHLAAIAWGESMWPPNPDPYEGICGDTA
jgi:phage I-like protein